MQTFELLTMVTFLTMYLGSAIRAIVAPDGYRAAEIAFYASGKPALFELAGFLLTGVAFVFLVLHFILEPVQLAQSLLYALVLLITLMMPFHFIRFYRERMTHSLKKKSSAAYRSSGVKRIVIGAAIVLLPYIYG
ncbi:MAG: hypothetical protein KFH87_05070 [Bacteroidetes bacterium]|nr:hypothetical protein [Bacteroidota bacterium]